MLNFEPSAGFLSLLAPILIIPPVFYYGSYGFRESKIVKNWKNYSQDIRVLAPYLRSQDKADTIYVFGLLAVILLCVAIGRGVNVFSPLLFHRILDKLSASDSQQSHFPWEQITGYILLRYFLKDIMGFVQWIVTRRLEYQVSDRISIAAYNKIMSLSAEYHDNKDSSATWLTVRESGDAISRFASNACFEIVPNILDLLLGAVAFGSVCGAHLALVLILVLVLYVVALAKTSEISSESAEELRMAVEQRDELSSGTISNWWTVYIFGRLGYEKDRYTKAVNHQRALDIEWCDSHWWSHNSKHSVMSFGVLLLCILVSRDTWYGGRNGGDLVLFLHLWNNLIEPVQNILDLNDRTKAFSLNVRRLVEMLRQEPTVTDLKGARDFQFKKGSIRVKDMSFTYKDKGKPAIQNISFDIEGGKTVAVVGKSGGGKSTLLKLLVRSYDATSGTIVIDGQDIKDVRRESLIQNISTVPQNIGMFNASILENLRYAKFDTTLEECEAACRAVGLHEKITDSFANGYNESIGEGGGKLSGGELQRLAIARVLLQDSRIVLLDEAMSNLDSETEFNIQEYLRKWAVGRTVVIVAHRLITISHADLILAVKDGRVVERGTHEELLAKKGYFYELWNLQQLK